MKVLILGPVTTSNYFGGVATFDEGLAIAFKHMNHEVTIITNQKVDRSYEVNVISVPKFRIRKTQQYKEADLIIASLDYGLCFKKNDTQTKILFLHGFFNSYIYGYFKSFLGILAQKIISRRSDYVFANSGFTSVINKRIYNLETDSIVPIGVGNQYMQSVINHKFIENNRNKNITYVGRVVKSKGIEKIIKAYLNIKNNYPNSILNIIGVGPDLEELMKKYEANESIKFLGRIENSKIYDFYRNSEVFISLNEAESFGITYLEALLAGCKIVCPNTGGQLEFLTNFMDRVSFVNYMDIGEISRALRTQLENDVSKVETSLLADKFNYSTTAKLIIENSKVK